MELILLSLLLQKLLESIAWSPFRMRANPANRCDQGHNRKEDNGGRFLPSLLGDTNPLPEQNIAFFPRIPCSFRNVSAVEDAFSERFGGFAISGAKILLSLSIIVVACLGRLSWSLVLVACSCSLSLSLVDVACRCR